jgi:hypothetical protein
VVVARWWRASGIAALVHLAVVSALILGSVALAIQSAVSSSRDLHGYVLIFSTLFAVLLVIPLLILIAARALIRQRRRAGLLLLGVYVATAVALGVASQPGAGAAVIVIIGLSTMVIVVATGIQSRSAQQQSGIA